MSASSAVQRSCYSRSKSTRREAVHLHPSTSPPRPPPTQACICALPQSHVCFFCSLPFIDQQKKEDLTPQPWVAFAAGANATHRS